VNGKTVRYASFSIGVAALIAVIVIVLSVTNRGPSKEEMEFLRLCKQGDIFYRARDMAEENPRLVNCRDKSHVTALHEAALSGNRELVEFLLEHGADVTARTKQGETVVQWAVRDPELQSFLMAKFIDAGGVEGER